MEVTESTDDQLMCIAAFRYCLGRQSYIVGSCLDWLPTVWPDLTQNTRLVVVRDIVEALQDGAAGSPTIDAPGWKRFAEWAWPTLGVDGQRWVRDAVRHREKPWPLETGD